jgi:agarase
VTNKREYILNKYVISHLFRFGACLLLLSCSYAQQGEESVTDAVSSFGITTDAKGKFWFLDPQGDQFLSIGINNIIAKPFRPRPNTRYYDPIGHQFDSYDEWKKDVHRILQQHGFNTIGSWSDGQLYKGPFYGTICLYVAAHGEDRCLDGLRPGFENRVRENVNLMLERYPHLDNTFGVFLDNEMPWYGHGAWGDISNYTLLEKALSLPDEDPARQAALNFLQQRYSSAEELSKAWGKSLSSWEELSFGYARSCVSSQAGDDRQAFIRVAADAFYKTACKTVRDMLPGKLILGTRFAAYAPEAVIRACGSYCDVISFNDYRPAPKADPEMLAKYWIWGGKKPLMVTEFSWRGEENSSGNPNSGGAGAVVKTQAERGENYQRYVSDLLSYPMVVGAHWFEFADQSPQGRFDGENSNYGIVDIYHRPYGKVLNAMKVTNEQLVKLHAEADRQVPQSLPKAKAVVFEPGQRPDRPPSVDLLKKPIHGPEIFRAPDAGIELTQEKDHLLAVIDTGSQWGCGISFYGPELFKVSSGPKYTTNLDGYSAIELDAKIGKDIVFDLFMDEAGVAAPNSVSYDTSAGDDAESFMIPTIRGRGQRYQYRFELKELQVRKEWGNQKGMRKVDIYAMKGPVIYFHGAQGKDQIRIYSIKIVR